MEERTARRRRIEVLTVLTAMLLLVMASASWAVVAGSGNSRLLVTQLSRSTGWSSGEGWVVANPVHPNVVTADWTSMPWPSPASTASGPGPHPMECGLGYSVDGGKTWVDSTLPPFQPDGLPANAGACVDPTLVTSPNGTLYAISNGGSVVPNAGSNQIPPSFCCTFTRSTDGGRTWSTPTRVATFLDEATRAPSTGTSTWAFDRPYLVIDPQTSTLYISISDDSLIERVVFASHDHGATWKGPYPLDPDDQSVWATVPAATHGMLAAAYVVDRSSKGYQLSRSPAVKCPQVCAVFETSVNDGQSWSRHVVPAAPVLAPGLDPLGPGVEVAADPTASGRYAVLVPATATTDQVWITTTGGSRWTRSLSIRVPGSDTFVKAWIAYGSTGALGVVYRDVHGDGSYDVKALVSTDRGRTFEGPVELSRGSAPADPPPQGSPGDDCACNLYLNATYLYTTWGDSRSGVLQVWFARYRY